MHSLLLKRMLSIFQIFLYLLIIQFPTSCKKKALEIAVKPIEAVVDEPTETDTTGTDDEDSADNDDNNPDTGVIVVGSSEGKALIIEGKQLDIGPGTEINIQAATYPTITIKNIKGAADNPVIIRNKGVVIIREKMETENIR